MSRESSEWGEREKRQKKQSTLNFGRQLNFIIFFSLFRILSDMYSVLSKATRIFFIFFRYIENFSHHIFFMEFQTSSHIDWRASDNTIFDGWMEMMKIDKSTQATFPSAVYQSHHQVKSLTSRRRRRKIENVNRKFSMWNFLLIFRGVIKILRYCAYEEKGELWWLRWNDRVRKWK